MSHIVSAIVRLCQLLSGFVRLSQVEVIIMKQGALWAAAAADTSKTNGAGTALLPKDNQPIPGPDFDKSQGTWLTNNQPTHFVGRS